jgi:hypothetical protein
VSPNAAPSFEPVYNAPMPEPELPPLPGEITMEELMNLARRLSEHPENRPGTDKTWVLERMRKFQIFMRDARDAFEAAQAAGFPKVDERK